MIKKGVGVLNPVYKEYTAKTIICHWYFYIARFLTVVPEWTEKEEYFIFTFSKSLCLFQN